MDRTLQIFYCREEKIFFRRITNLAPTQTSPQQVRKHGQTQDLGAIEKYLICKSIVVIGIATSSPISRISSGSLDCGSVCVI